jgi:hypothetical protein
MKTNESQKSASQQSEALPLYVDAFARSILIDWPTSTMTEGAQATTRVLIGATIGYVIREYCNYYMEGYLDSNQNSQRLLKASLCAGVSGSIKNSIVANTLEATRLVLGAYNHFMHDALAAGKLCNSNSTFCIFANTLTVELSEGFLEKVFTDTAGWSQVIHGAKVGLYAASFEAGAYAPFSVYLNGAYKHLAEHAKGRIACINEHVISADGFNKTPLRQVNDTYESPLVRQGELVAYEYELNITPVMQINVQGVCE